MAGLSVVEPLAVQQHQSLAKIAAADGEIGLDAAGRAFLQIE
jgi:hypothetical protein